jgi:hypothetical protein
VLDDDIRRRIEKLRLSLVERGSPDPTPAGPGRQIRIEDLGGAREIAGELGSCLIIERKIPRDVRATPDSLREAARFLLRDFPEAGIPVFLDLETTGFSATPLFLAGMCFEEAGDLKGLQILARDYSEEAALLDLLDGMLARYRVCVTFNGKSFDMPYIRERAKYHRLRLRASPEQFDLLHHARRAWKRDLPNCRLVTLERYILGRTRVGDVPGWEVPCIYHDFVHTSDARRLKGVLLHNLIDVFSMTELFVSLAEVREC